MTCCPSAFATVPRPGPSPFYFRCTFCIDRIDLAEETGLTPGVDHEVTPACVNSCISGAMVFGDIEDPDSNISKLLEETKSFRQHEELGTGPGVYYIWDKE